MRRFVCFHQLLWLHQRSNLTLQSSPTKTTADDQRQIKEIAVSLFQGVHDDGGQHQDGHGHDHPGQSRLQKSLSGRKRLLEPPSERRGMGSSV